MPLHFKKRILAHIAHDNYETESVQAMAANLGIADDDVEEFRRAINELAEEGQVLLGSGEGVMLPPMGERVVGTFRKNQRGFGFIVPTDTNAHGDLFVPAGATGDAADGDTVEAKVLRSRRGGPPGRSPFTGEIVRVLQRRRTHTAGELRKQGGQWLVYPDGKKSAGEPIVVPDAESKNAKEGDKVVVEITIWPEGDYLGEGVITKVLGASGRPDVETQAVIEAFGLPGEFPDAVVENARRCTRQYDEEIKAADESGGFDPTERLDLRDEYIVTIDPPDAKDYDDAISIERVKEVAGGGPGWRLGVHIADVAHFVTPGSALDDEASDRCNSCYLPRLVIPMLPEILSNGICSLSEGNDRFCKSVFIDYDEQGRVRARGYAQTIIRSAKRTTYLEAQALIDGDPEEASKHAKTDTPHDEKLVNTLREMNRLAKAIERRRDDAGMIHLDLPDVELVYDDDGRVVDAVPEDDAYTHTLIEMFMVEANEAIATLFEDLEIPVLRRIHPEPVPGSFDDLQSYVRVAGYRIPKSATREDIQALLKATKGKDSAPAVHMAVLRTLTRAEYSPALIGHFALASGAYSHFTSPIRRYPDLTVHRALAAYLKLTKNGTDRPKSDSERKVLGRELRDRPECPDQPTLVQVGNRCNGREENATEAERDLRQFLVLQLLEEHLGESFPGIVTGVMQRGVFVRLDKYLAEGMVKAEDLPIPQTDASGTSKGGFRRGGVWKLDGKSGALVEQRTGRSFQMGDRVSVTIVSIDLPARKMELAITDAASRLKGKAKQPTKGGGAGTGDASSGNALANALRLGDVEELKPKKTGTQKRSQRSKSRDKRKSDYRGDRKDKGKRQ
ncbi:MAG: VacB/RNase II family 3'-5' exoribonuclease [Planctomycetota bacterium]